MNYSENEGMCRVDFWKDSGKWHQSAAIDMSFYYHEPLIHEALRKSLGLELNKQLKGMRATCICPYHIHSHPISIIV